MARIHIPLSCKAVFYQMQTLKLSMHEHCTGCQTLGRKSFSHSEEDAILRPSRGCVHHYAPLPLASAPSPSLPPFDFLLSARGDAHPRVWAPRQPVGGTVTVRLLISPPAAAECSGFSPHYICLSSGAFTAGRKSLCLLMIMQLIKEPIILARHVQI